LGQVLPVGAPFGLHPLLVALAGVEALFFYGQLQPLQGPGQGRPTHRRPAFGGQALAVFVQGVVGPLGHHLG
jgi:hypothetical protein